MQERSLSNQTEQAGVLFRAGSAVDIERRSEARIADDSPARIKELNPMVSLGPSLRGRLVNTSSKGLKVSVPRSIVQGSVVQVRFRDRIVVGQVKYCTPVEQEFIVGIRLKEDW